MLDVRRKNDLHKNVFTFGEKEKMKEVKSKPEYERQVKNDLEC